MRDLILDVVREEGPIPFERFMELALYHPEAGFFTGAHVRSRKEGDFLTSPEVSRLFGHTVAEFVRHQRQRVGGPFRLIEVAGGSGSLLRPLLEAEPVEGWAVEASPAARRALAKVVGPDRVVSTLDEVPAPFSGVILANELLDNLPMALAQKEAGGWRERWVAATDAGLELVDADPRIEVEEWLARFSGPVDDGGWVEVQIAAGRWVERTVAMLTAGAVVMFDYGDTAGNLAGRRREGTLRTYRGHHLGPDPLHEPGASDITADVNLTAVEAAAVAAGAAVSVWRQDDFLAAYGLADAIDEMRERELALARGGQEMERLKVRTLRTEAETLMHPRGLGDFRVVVAEV